MEPVTPENIEAALAYQPYFEDENSTFYTLDTPPPPDENGNVPLPTDPYIYSSKVQDFITALYKNNLAQGYNWPEWPAERYLNDPARVASADLETLIKLFTYHVRLEVYFAGHLAGVIRSGHVLQLLQRLKRIHQEILEAS